MNLLSYLTLKLDSLELKAMRTIRDNNKISNSLSLEIEQCKELKLKEFLNARDITAISIKNKEQ